MGDEADDTGIGAAIQAAMDAIDGKTPEGDWTPIEPAGDPAPGAIEQMGNAVRGALEYAHDVDDDPPLRTGPYPAGGPS
jgi:hypothetical protein